MTSATRLAIATARAVEGPAYQKLDEDGLPYITCDWTVEAGVPSDPDHAYIWTESFRWRFEAEAFADQVMEAGTINPERWATRTKYGTQAWITEGCEAEQIAWEREMDAAPAGWA